MISSLHDAIDEQEDLREIAAEIVEKIQGEVPAIAARCGSFEEILETIAKRVEEELAETTTTAALKGMAAGKKLTGRKP